MILTLHFASCAFMTGVIWIVQRVHYPAFHFVRGNDFIRFSRLHQAAIFPVVGIPMLIELATGVLLCKNAGSLPQTFVFFNLFLIVLLWASTFFFSMPLHRALTEKGYNQKSVDRLVLTNVVRTSIWSLRLLLLVYFISNIPII
jgi:hypothetical protein